MAAQIVPSPSLASAHNSDKEVSVTMTVKLDTACQTISSVTLLSRQTPPLVLTFCRQFARICSWWGAAHQVILRFINPAGLTCISIVMIIFYYHVKASLKMWVHHDCYNQSTIPILIVTLSLWDSQTDYWSLRNGQWSSQGWLFSCSDKVVSWHESC